MDRREFLRTSLLGSVVACMPTRWAALPAGGAEKSMSNPAPEGRSVVDPALLARRARQYFLDGRSEKALHYYREAIDQDPGTVAWYDGAVKVMSSKNDCLASLDLYQMGLGKSPDSIYFMDRVAKIYIRIALGNSDLERKFLDQKGGPPLLNRAARLYLRAARRSPNNAFLTRRLKRVVKAVNLRRVHTKPGRNGNVGLANQLIVRVRKQINSRPTPRSPQHRRIQRLPEQALERRLRRSAQKKGRRLTGAADRRRESQNRRKRKRLVLEIARRRADGFDLQQAEEHLKNVREIDPSDTEHVGRLRKIYRLQGAHDKLVKLAREHAQMERSTWSRIGLAKALRESVSSGNGSLSSLNEAASIFDSILTESEPSSPVYLAAVHGLARCDATSGNRRRARRTFARAMDVIPVTKRHVTQTLVLGIVKQYRAEGRLQPAETLLRMLLGEHEMRSSDAPDVVDEEVALGLRLAEEEAVSPTASIHIPVLHALAAVYGDMNQPSGRDDCYRRVLDIQPKDRSAAAAISG